MSIERRKPVVDDDGFEHVWCMGEDDAVSITTTHRPTDRLETELAVAYVSGFRDALTFAQLYPGKLAELERHLDSDDPETAEKLRPKRELDAKIIAGDRRADGAGRVLVN